jgi:rod shape-determining protein MreD
MRAVYLLIGFVIIFCHLLPLNLTPKSWAGPDLLLAVTFAWALRRPDYVPALAIAGLFLLADLLFQRPPGLLAALALLATEWLKSRERRHRSLTFAVEWSTVALFTVLVAIGYRLLMAIVILEPGPLFMAAMQTVMTILIYPLVVVVSRLVFRVRRPGLGEMDAAGQRL